MGWASVPAVSQATPAVTRLLRKVRVDADGCWIWTGHTGGTRSTYGYFRPTTKATDPKALVHRWAYEHWIGPIPAGMEVDHTCRHTLCLCPDHLELVTSDENSRRARLVTCRAGRHDLTDPANVQWDKQGRRRGCVVCHREKALAYWRARKAGQ
jgi:hypothetical protein